MWVSLPPMAPVTPDPEQMDTMPYTEVIANRLLAACWMNSCGQPSVNPEGSGLCKEHLAEFREPAPA